LGLLALTITIVSTVLRPVGPHDARVYWLRRAVVLALIAVIVIVLVTALSGGSGKPAAAGPKSTPKPSTSTSTPPSSTAAVAACNLTDLKLVLSTSSDLYKSGQQATLNGVFTNPGTTPCTLDVTPAHETWTVTSGADHIWTTQGCNTSTAKASSLKIKAGGTKTVSTVWDGRRLDPDCTAGTAALPGTYHLHATLDGVKGESATFHITS
jgi:hypothetical protein